MPKTCKQEDCNYPVWGGGYCQRHQGFREPKPRKPLKPRSGKRKKKDVIYSVLRKDFLENHPVCQICASDRSTDIHHIYAGADRDKYMNDTSTWMALCRDCHQNRVHLDPLNARKNGWLK